MAGETKLALKGSQARSIAVDPLDPRRVYLGTMDSGLWFSCSRPARGAWTEICMAFAALDALREGYEVYRWSTQSAARRSRLTALGSSHAKAPTTSPTVGLRQSVFELNA
jgi:hypothetical protein